jgi:DNA-directed RNA polymerase subunit L
MREAILRLKVIRRTSRELKIQVENEGHTFCNLLESVLLEDEDVEFASYEVPHPLVSNTLILIRTKRGKRPEEALRIAVEKILQRGKELSKEFSKSLKKWKK